MTKVTRLTINDGQGAQSRRIHLREISGDLDAPLETVGQDLRTARLRRGDDLATVSRVLKIRREHLEALEEDRFEALPGRTYAVGFVRSYADFLGLDSSQLVERFKAEIAGRTDYASTPVHVIDEDHRRLPQGWIIIAGVVVLMLAYGAYHLVISADEMLSQPVTPPPPQAVAASKPVQKTASAAVNLTPATQFAVPTAAPTSPGTTAPGAQQGAVSPPQSEILANGPVTPSTATQSNPDAAISPGTVMAALPPGQIYGTQYHDPRVVLRAHVATQVLVQGPNKAVFINRTLKPGDVFQVPNMVGLTLTTPNGGAVEIDLDGSQMGFAGKDNQTTEALSLDPQAIVDRYNGSGG